MRFIEHLLRARNRWKWWHVQPMAGCVGRVYTLPLAFTMTLKGRDCCHCGSFEETEGCAVWAAPHND